MRYVRTDTYKIYDDLRCTRAVLLSIDSYWLCANISITRRPERQQPEECYSRHAISGAVNGVNRTPIISSRVLSNSSYISALNSYPQTGLYRQALVSPSTELRSNSSDRKLPRDMFRFNPSRIFCVKLSINHIVRLVHKNHIIRTCLMYHATCKVEFQPFKRLYSQLTFFNF